MLAGVSRPKNKRNKARKAAPAGNKPTRVLAWQQYQELNFSFYEEHPSEFINMRVEVLSLMLCDELQLSAAYGAERSIKGVQLGGSTPPNQEQRRRFLQMETVVILHHAAETLLRLFYAHVEHEDCPWLGMASLILFAEFKQKVDKSLSSGFGREQLAKVFLAGTSPQDASIAMTTEQFEDAVDGLELLLTVCGRRILSEAFLYNAIKHGLSAISLDEATRIGRRLPNGETVIGHKGSMFAYMHKPRRPGDKDPNRQWFISMSGAKTEQDLALTLLAANAIESLWDVARRRYTGRSGSIRYISRAVVETVVHGLQMQSMNIVNTVTMEMPKLNADGTFNDIVGDFVMNQVPQDYHPAEGENPTDCPRINLPKRQRDERVFSTSKKALFPFSPNGSQWV